MAKVDLVMPKMGESIVEATILKWLKQEGDDVALDESILEIATDKVDSEVPSPIEGKIAEILYKEGDVVAVGEAIARIETGGAEGAAPGAKKAKAPAKSEKPMAAAKAVVNEPSPAAKPQAVQSVQVSNKSANRFYSPLVLNIARQEGIAMPELEGIGGTGKEGRVTKRDMLAYVKHRSSNGQASSNGFSRSTISAPPIVLKGNEEIVEMDRMRKLIADHMVMSKAVSPHVTSFVEADVTNLVNWRNKVKGGFHAREGEKITFTPLFIEAVVNAISDFRGVNVSVDGSKIIYKKEINIGVATALPSGNLIVPVVKNADQLSLKGITKEANRLIQAARTNKLKPEDIQDGTFTLTNVGTFGNLSGTPIINQPQVAILATGAIIKKPAVLETEHGDVIAIRQMMMMSLSYDHRVVDGFLGGSFLRRVADNLENFDSSREV